MREKRNLLIGIGLGAMLGWTLGFLRLPFLEKNFSFLLGFIACLVIVFLGLLIMYVWKKKSSTPSTFQKKSFLSFLTLSLILAGGFVSSFLFFQQSRFSKIQAQQQHKKLAEQFELETTTRKSNSLILMNNLFDKIEEELKSNANRMLSDEMIERIAALNYSFKPYSYFDGEKFSGKKWSPERGQLLLSLAKMKMDSTSFSQLKSKTSFLGADLKNVDLAGADLSNANLQEANFDDANLTGVNLSNAILERASLQKTNLQKANLQKVNFKDADLNWADFHLAKLNQATFNGANLANAKLRNVDLTEADLSWANLKNTFLNGANLTKAKILEANLSRTNLSNAILIETILTSTNLEESTLNNANFTNTQISNMKTSDKDWVKNLTEWKVVGAEDIQKNYTVEKDPSPHHIYRLQKVKK
ncbi:MAG: pentapeptide repeat-containing protein [Saprospiraceae bacterium]